MDYVKHYSALIARARARELIGPSESHHVIPRCMGGKDGQKNEVELTPEEHYLAHLLLVRIFPRVPGLLLAAVMMSRDNRNGKRANNKMYGWLRRRASEAQSARMVGFKHTAEARSKMSAALKASEAYQAAVEARRGVPRTEETKRKTSESHKTSELAKAAREQLFERKVGVPRSAETRAKVGDAHRGRALPDEHRAKIGDALRGKPKSAEHVAKVSAALKGKPGTRLGAVLSDETKAKMREAAKRRVYTEADSQRIKDAHAKRTPEERRAAALKAWETKRRAKA